MQSQARRGRPAHPMADESPPTQSMREGTCVRDRASRTPAKEISTCHSLMLVFFPWFVFIAVSIAFAIPYHQYQNLVWALVVSAALIFVFLVNREMRDQYRPWRFYCAVLCLVALLLATFLGLFTYDQFLGNYWHSRDSHVYANVLPSEDAAGYADAGKLVFADEARVDVSRALGYKDVDVFCVAPIVDDAVMTEVQFWAVGVDCCERRGTFKCDDTWDPDARSGVVVSSERQWHAQYAMAVQQAAYAFEIASAPGPIFVRWVVDPDKLTVNYFRFGMGIIILATVLHGVISAIIAHILRSTTAKRGGGRPKKTLTMGRETSS